MKAVDQKVLRRVRLEQELNNEISLKIQGDGRKYEWHIIELPRKKYNEIFKKMDTIAHAPSRYWNIFEEIKGDVLLQKEHHHIVIRFI